MIKSAFKATLYILLLAMGLSTQAQNITKSPYSIIGLGELVYSGNAQSYAMGQTTKGYRSGVVGHYIHPAS